MNLGQILNQVSNGETSLLDPEVLTTGYEQYEKTQSDPPSIMRNAPLSSSRHSSTALRLWTALHADFSVWVPYGLRMMKRQKSARSDDGKVFGADGLTKTIEIVGPGTYDDWEKSYRLFTTACLMFTIAAIKRLEGYMLKIRAAGP